MSLQISLSSRATFGARRNVKLDALSILNTTKYPQLSRRCVKFENSILRQCIITV